MRSARAASAPDGVGLAGRGAGRWPSPSRCRRRGSPRPPRRRAGARRRPSCAAAERLLWIVLRVDLAPGAPEGHMPSAIWSALRWWRVVADAGRRERLEDRGWSPREKPTNSARAQDVERDHGPLGGACAKAVLRSAIPSTDGATLSGRSATQRPASPGLGVARREHRPSPHRRAAPRRLRPAPGRGRRRASAGRARPRPATTSRTTTATQMGKPVRPPEALAAPSAPARRRAVGGSGWPTHGGVLWAAAATGGGEAERQGRRGGDVEGGGARLGRVEGELGAGEGSGRDLEGPAWSAWPGRGTSRWRRRGRRRSCPCRSCRRRR